MSAAPHLAIFGASLVSCYWNGAATYYRGILSALAGRGLRVTFFEPDAYERQAHRDIDDPPWAEVVVFRATPAGAASALERASNADVLIKASGLGACDEQIEAAVAAGGRRDGQLRVFWDVDAPATLDRLRLTPDDPFRACVPGFDLVLTYGGGQPVIDAYRALGARRVVPIYNALDPRMHFRVPAAKRFTADLSLLANRLPDREQRIREFFLCAAARARDRQFILGGAGWQQAEWPSNVRYLGHVGTADHNALNSSARAVLNVTRDSMAACGFSPPTRVFEAAGAAACVITDAWEGIDRFLEPGREVLVARSGAEVADLLTALDPSHSRAIGEAARRRVLAEHTYDRRAREVERVFARGEAA